ncbi:hypothetical protein SNK04_012515 [Fusarium graminearum]
MANHHASPTMMQMQQHQGQVPPPPPPPPPGVQPAHFAPSHQIAAMNEAVWLQIGSYSEVLRNPDEAMQAYERALQANPNSTPAMNAIGVLLKGREAFEKALEFFRAIVQLDQNNGEAWGNLGHCYLMTENLQKAYDAYQQALVNLRDPKDPMLWYGIGILYDRYGSYDYAEEAFSQVMNIQPDFEKANEIYFRLGIIYKQQNKWNQSLDCFKYIVNSPPGPLTQEDIWFQIGHVHEQQKDFDSAKAAYQRVLDHSPNHAKVLQQLGWLHHQQSNTYESQDRAIQYLEKSVNADNQDAQSWYLLGRCYMSQQKYPKAYEAYQQAVYRDGKNPTFWCSIGVLYYQINQYRDALDAYSRAIRLNPYISEVWYDLGTLYESCNNQITDALDAYQRAAELDPNNPHIKARLQLLRSGGTNGGPPPTAPQPADVHPQAYQAAGPVGPQWGGSTQQPPAAGPPPPPQGPGENWAGRLSNINPPPQPPNPYEARGGEQFRGPAPPLRQPSPQQEQLRQPYNDPGRGGPRRGQTPLLPPPPGHQYSQPPHAPPRLNPQPLPRSAASQTLVGLEQHLQLRHQRLHRTTSMAPMVLTVWRLSDLPTALALMADPSTTTACLHPSRLILSIKRLHYTTSIPRCLPLVTRTDPKDQPVPLHRLPRLLQRKLPCRGWMTGRLQLDPRGCESGRRNLLPRSKPTKRTEFVSMTFVTEECLHLLGTTTAATHLKLGVPRKFAGLRSHVAKSLVDLNQLLVMPSRATTLLMLLITHLVMLQVLAICLQCSKDPQPPCPESFTRSHQLWQPLRRSAHPVLSMPLLFAQPLFPSLNEQPGRWKLMRTMTTVEKMRRRLPLSLMVLALAPPLGTLRHQLLRTLV